MVMMVIGMVIVVVMVMIVFVRTPFLRSTLRPAECANAPTWPTWAAQNASSPHLRARAGRSFLLGDLHITGVDLDTAGLNRQG